jgi:hypothetical protein
VAHTATLGFAVSQKVLILINYATNHIPSLETHLLHRLAENFLAKHFAMTKADDLKQLIW